MPPRPLATFLQAARAALNTPAAQRPSPLTIVVGNESADLDSLCSAVLAAYFRSHTPPHNAASTLHIPLANLVRDDLKLRPELAAALASPSPSCAQGGAAGIPLDSLITLSDLPDDLAAADTRWLLVDHNALTGDLARRFAARIVGCIDHHVDEGAVPLPDASTGRGPRVIETAGSCASLVVRELADGGSGSTTSTWRRLAADEPDRETDRILARLALAPILIDTTNLTSPSKTTDTDRHAASVAEAALGMEGGDGEPFPYDRDAAYERTAFFKELSRRKDDISQFSYSDILRKDYKQWQEPGTAAAQDSRQLTLGMSTVVQGFDYLLGAIGDTDTLFRELHAFATQRNLDIAAVMTAHADDATGFGRELMLWAFSEPAVRAVRLFVETNAARLQLTPWRDGLLDAAEDAATGAWRVCWTQGSVEYSRKQLAPFLRDAMRSA